MAEMNRRERLIHLAMCGTLTPSQLFLLSRAMEKEPDLSLEKLIIKGNLFPTVQQAYSVLDKTKKIGKLIRDQKVDREYKRLHIHVSTIYDTDYPLELRELYQPPAVLFYQGKWSLTEGRKLGIVGSRKITLYGRQALTQLLPDLVDKKVVIVSGLALGIDREAHLQTISLGGNTISVIGTGLDYFYPKNNMYLQEKISKEHLLISEYPLGMPPQKHHFPMRNRIIAGLSQGTLVIEAKERSGSLITANVALQENREVFAIPGSILEDSYRGTNQLIQAGATLVLNANDIFQEMEYLWKL